MRLRRFIAPRLILLDVQAQSRDELLRLIASRIAAERPMLEPQALEQALRDREAVGGTAVGHGVALPHARVRERFEGLVGLARLSQPVDFDAPDGEPVWLTAFSAVDASESHRHLQILARLARVFHSQANREALKRAQTPEEVMDILLRDDEPSGP